MKRMGSRITNASTDIRTPSKLDVYNEMTANYNSKKKASIIICSHPKCDARCIETKESTLVETFVRHLEIMHSIKPSESFTTTLKNKISYIRNSQIPYTDPFIHVPWESLSLAKPAVSEKGHKDRQKDASGMPGIQEIHASGNLCYKLWQHLASVTTSNQKTDLLDWYPEGHYSKVIDTRKYYNQAYHYLKIGRLKPVPKFCVSLSDLSRRLVIELADLSIENWNHVLKQAVALIFQEINSDLYHNSISKVFEVDLIE